MRQVSPASDTSRFVVLLRRRFEMESLFCMALHGLVSEPSSDDRFVAFEISDAYWPRTAPIRGHEGGSCGAESCASVHDRIFKSCAFAQLAQVVDRMVRVDSAVDFEAPADIEKFEFGRSSFGGSRHEQTS